MISEKHIESVIAKMQTEGYEDNFALDQPDYWHYLNSENFKSLTEPEHQLLFFINSVIFHSLEDFDFDMEQYEISEEDNWSIREANKSWTDTKNILFDNYEQEDLLAFVEDMWSKNSIS